MTRPIAERIRQRGIFAFASESEWRRSNRVAYFYMAREIWQTSSLHGISWYCRWLAARCMAIYVVMTVIVFLLRREIPTLHAIRTRNRAA